ncbi:MAG TPA: hypothetical protein VFZ09_47485 [Archangium sp.]|uniref:hypothetical protein n=1 Tax=Archangium sp. TaxID=1872627 RepID=UPI002E3251BA|nr:hypothetical protein [Archangium sp.]HEX5753919.1 hypothetical protein [Archangium sp.]
MRGTVLFLATLFTVACGGPVEEGDGPAAPSQAAVSEEVTPVPANVGAMSTCGESYGSCATGEVCCYPCGIEGCLWQCMAVTRCPKVL